VLHIPKRYAVYIFLDDCIPVQLVAGHSEADPGLADRAHLYGPLFHVFWLAALIRGGLERVTRGRLAGWQVHGMGANERLRRYLARGRAWQETNFAKQLEELAEVTFLPGC
jgi:hypothetical protein